MKDIARYDITDLALFSELSEAELSALRGAMHFRRYARGETVFRSGDKPDGLYLIAEGRFKVTFLRPDGKEQILYVYGKDDFIGGFNLIANDSFRYTTEALESTVIGSLGKDAFEAIVLSHPALSLRFLRKAFERIRHSEALVMRLVYQDADAKVASLLLDLMTTFSSETERGPLLKLSLNREEMGNFVGLARETVARRLSAFQELGLIWMPRPNEILLLDLEGLKALCH